MVQNRKSTTSQDKQGYHKGDVTTEYKILTPDHYDRSELVYGSAEKDSQIKNQGQLVHLPDPKLQDFLTDWLQRIAQPILQPDHYQHYHELIDQYIIPDLGEITLQSFLPQQLQQYYQQKYAEGYSVQMVNHLHHILHQAFTAALNYRLVATNICDAVKPDRQIPDATLMSLSHLDHERVCRILIRIAMYFEEEDHENISAKRQ
ncbi:hypothetical protein [Dictyobacter kobayashii]|uniref:Integrase SAM-like N-terminal domain-containing protein n=1 Tax=Dictyobacter kobayashii TaxID=2014872 RepID=A0A402AT86_9CHLR|nr:hypothetical protein [Dictyobacter kobayashii]GCE22253.1 hypothetical protein KDK_60530 [Dictyobacter kobayashii]